MSDQRERSAAPDNVDQLRHDIDSGKTGDKVRAPDPAAAPLGTDEEAAGTPPSPKAIAAARRAERTRSVPKGKSRFASSLILVPLFFIALILLLFGILTL